MSRSFAASARTKIIIESWPELDPDHFWGMGLVHLQLHQELASEYRDTRQRSLCVCEEQKMTHYWDDHDHDDDCQWTVPCLAATADTRRRHCGVARRRCGGRLEFRPSQALASQSFKMTQNWLGDSGPGHIWNLGSCYVTPSGVT